MKRKLVVIEWADAWSAAGWKTREYIETEGRPSVVRSVGWIAKSDRQGVTLAGGIADIEDYIALMYIPRGMIKSMTEIKGAVARCPDA